MQLTTEIQDLKTNAQNETKNVIEQKDRDIAQLKSDHAALVAALNVQVRQLHAENQRLKSRPPVVVKQEKAIKKEEFSTDAPPSGQ